jgi:hypothetical protein
MCTVEAARDMDNGSGILAFLWIVGRLDVFATAIYLVEKGMAEQRDAAER